VNGSIDHLNTHFELRVFTAPSLISTIHKSLHSKYSQSSLVSWQRLLTVVTLPFVTADRAELLSTVNSTIAPSLLSLPSTPQLNCQTTPESELLYDWWFTANQFVLTSSPWDSRPVIFFQHNTCGHSPYVTSSLTRGWVCRLQLLLALANAFILRSESRGTHDHILLSQIRGFPNPEDQVPVFISPRNRVTPLYPQALGSLFVASYDSQGYDGGIRPQHGNPHNSENRLT
jgi:hypothetical protein